MKWNQKINKYIYISIKKKKKKKEKKANTHRPIDAFAWDHLARRESWGLEPPVIPRRVAADFEGSPQFEVVDTSPFALIVW